VDDGLTSARPQIELRPATPDDREALVAIYRTTREDELELTGWDEEQRAAFVEMQFAAQDRFYHDAYPDRRFLLILVNGGPVGRIYLARLADELRVVDLAILPSHRGLGIGSALLADVIAEAEAAGLPIRLHVEPWNPARRLYERLGFVTIEVRGFYELMERPPADQLKTAS
jgi:ribosomal protein S18 acetylase RimI-like enzyme